MVLRHRDRELLRFEWVEPQGVRVVSVNEAERRFLPLEMHGVANDETLWTWLTRRIVPKHRHYIQMMLGNLGIMQKDTRAIIEMCKGLSLNDVYWVVPDGFSGAWKDFNLYDNPFSKTLAVMAFTGGFRGEFNPAREETTSPEFTTNGMLAKCWRRREEGVFLFKGGTEGAANAGREPYSEFYACQIAERMGLHAVHYDLENWKDILASKCRLFTDIDTSYVSIGRIVKSGGIQACLDFYESIGKDAAEELKSMLVFDAVIYNEDRHFGNFGILRDNHSGRIIGPAPIFDNGLSLFNYAMPDDIQNLAEYAKTRANPYGVSYEAICREVMGTRQRNQLRRLIGFRFTRHPSINLPEERLTAIEKQIDLRVRELLALPRAK